jgi:hypothetical protein
MKLTNLRYALFFACIKAGYYYRAQIMVEGMR